MDAILLIVIGVGLTTFLLRLESWPSNRLPGPLPAADTAWAMSEENVETVKRGFDAITRLDAEEMLEFMDPEIDFRPRFQLMLGGEAAEYHGYAGIREAFRDVYSALDWIKPEVSEIRDLGDRIVALGHLRIRGKATGIEADASAGWVVDIRDGRAVQISEYLDHAQALEAAGLSE